MEDDDDIFGTSDTEDKQPRSTLAVEKRAKLDEDLFEDSEEDVQPKQKQLKNKKRKRAKRDESDNENATSTRQKRKPQQKKNGRSQKKEPGNESARKEESDEYDSGPELERTKEDDEFIDEDDDLDIVDEYNAETQNFNDEPIVKTKPSSKSRSKASEGKHVSSKGDDPLSEMLRDIKRSKAKELTDDEKSKIVDELCSRMEKAWVEDNKDRSQGKPAMHKLALLPFVEQAVSMTSLHQAILSSNFLQRLGNWITPSEESQALPALSLRYSVYKMLQSLPCSPDDLKRSEIGKTVAKLRKHPMESAPHKALLKEIIEKWSRLVFGKSTDLMAQTSSASNIPAVLLAQQNTSNRASDPSASRARIPMSNGYVFTVALDNTDLVGGSNAALKPVNEKREKLFKKISERSSMGKKANSRAIDSSVSGKNIQL